jgi:class 3 adenylate cyclase
LLLRLSLHFYALSQRLSLLHDGDFTTSDEKKYNTETNRLYIFFIGQNLLNSCLFPLLFLVNVLVFGEYLWAHLVVYSSIYFVAAVAMIGLFFLKLRCQNNPWLNFATLQFGLCELALLAILMGSKSGIQYYAASLLPLPLVAFPLHRKLRILVLLTSAVTIAATFYLQQRAPLLPLPDNVNVFLFSAMTICAFLCALFLIAFYIFQRGKHIAMKQFWLRFVNYGTDKLLTEKEQREASVSNALIFLSITVSSLLLFVVLVTCSILWLRDFTAYFWHMPVLSSLAVVHVVTMLGAYYFKPKVRWRLFFEYLPFFINMLLLDAAVLLIGQHSSLQYMHLLLIPIPLLASSSGKLIKSTVISVTVLAYVALITFGPNLPIPLQLPPDMQQVVSFISKYLSLAVIIILFFYFWWKYEFTKRIQRLWARLGTFGAEKFNSAGEKKLNAMSNYILLIFFMLMVYNLLCMLGSYAYLLVLNARQNWTYIFAGIPAVAATGIVLLAFRIKNHLGNRNLWIAVLSCGVLFLISAAHFFGKECGFQWIILTYISLPFFILKRSEVRQIVYCELITIAGFCYVIFSGNMDPLFPLPPVLVKVSFIEVIIAMLALFFATSYYLWVLTDNAEKEIQSEREKSEQLLLNILPEAVVAELREKGSATPVQYESATVLFTDFVGFTSIAETLSPQELLKELDNCFSYFDTVCQKYGLEKLKTIGDSFMCAAGIPIPNKTHAIDAALAAIEIRDFMAQIKELKEMQGLPYWQLRIGMHTGPLIAGVVGEKKFAYDIWGDSVNIASRMESSGTAGQINISKETYNNLKYLFSCEFRGKVKAKNKGEIQMYFLNQISPKLSVKGEGRVPNGDFKYIYDAMKNGARLVLKEEVPIGTRVEREFAM